MLPNFLVEELTIRESGESRPFACAEHFDQPLVLTLCIAHAVEHESMELEIHGSVDGTHWFPKPLKSFPPKSWCGSYDLTLPPSTARYLKAVWRVTRWAGGDAKPFFRFNVFVQQTHRRAMAGAA